jgi:hypothetical protein
MVLSGALPMVARKAAKTVRAVSNIVVLFMGITISANHFRKNNLIINLKNTMMLENRCAQSDKHRWLNRFQPIRTGPRVPSQ